MAKNLTDRVKKEIVKTQIDFLKTNYPNELVNYDTLGKYLAKSLIHYSPKGGEINEKVDVELLTSLQGNRRSGAAVRLLNCAHAVIEESELFNIKDRDLMQLYEYDKERKQEGRGIRNFGEQTKILLISYLTKKGLIGEKK